MNRIVVFSGNAHPRLARIVGDVGGKNVIVFPTDERLPKMSALSVALLLAEAIHRIHVGESVSSLFDATE